MISWQKYGALLDDFYGVVKEDAKLFMDYWCDKEGLMTEDEKARSGLDFSDALTFLRTGHNLSRLGWQYGGMFPYVYQVPSMLGMEEQINHVDQNGTVTLWRPLQDDLLARDWMVVENDVLPQRKE